MAVLNPGIAPGAVGPLLGGLSAPLAAVSTRYGDVANAQIAVAITAASIVLHRPRIIVQLYHTNYTCELVAASGVLAVNFLAPDQLPLIWRLGMRSGRDGDKLADVPLADIAGANAAGADIAGADAVDNGGGGLTGSPILAGCFGYLDCRVVNAMDGGDMTAFLAEVVSGATWGDAPLRWREARPRLPQQWAEEWERKIAGEMAIAESRMLRI